MDKLRWLLYADNNTFQDGGYFGFKVISLVNDIGGDHQILFHNMKKIIMNNHLHVI
jgi:hypothetical protein